VSKERIIIAGGGVTGLTAAYRLSKQARELGADAEIILVERDERLGGKTQTEVVDGMVIEQGPDSFLVHKPWFAQLCKELGLPTVGTNPKVKTTYIYHKGRLEQLPVGMQLMIPTEVWPFVKTRLISPAGKLRAGLEPLMPVKRTEEDESIGSFVGRRFGQEILEFLAGPLMGGIHGGDFHTVSMKATFPNFMKMERESGSLLLQGWRNKANKPKGPTGSAFQTIPSGLNTAVEALINASEGVTYLTGTSITGLERTADGRYNVALSNGEQVDAAAVVLATPAYVAADLVGGFLPDVAAELSAIPYGNSCVVSLAFDRKDVNHPLDASGFLVPMREPIDVTASTWVSVKWPHSAPDGKVLIRCFVGRGTGKDWTQEPDEVLVNTALAGLKQAMGLDAKPTHTVVAKWPRGMAQYKVGHLERIDKVDAMMAKAPGLCLAGAAYRGVGLPDCVREGTQAAEKVAKHLRWDALVEV
jgi:protoporphyrinogen/coproporphyrinogen III oxidase